ncbi:tRNA (adenosine(37)-N6)-threonylcarbamoyltransferase complex dimerization subunit type 1 TsaB [Noviherbaspirillum galbum]|uniref:tRNA (Adenosine(37)-N6)-threonylcarbamoyltransferase complex dimerization subunit type 1 TsaB n=1 Tax=Noviherbaspirillum galbum TaxID=2709383 RepID=A0A6B3SPS6_9BURK|nr:tRNA (adenosine(37)-N6)-threonylcarbamoyltransferase complex dimerization subunit type 1 TsaB [Noviherbaspirillum galbum]NEX62834.1 tRNA (adenosine(37)-N6)-threonylcarbamoyltransferase complex dimerization subunit type 1 TsaB [Noviherbaspirillum galbum]
MSTLLALETSTEVASVALLHGGEVHCLESSGVQTHSQSVLPMAQRLLADAGLALRDCDAIAFGAGPGSFTGVRTACGIAQGLAFGAGLPVVPVVTLLAMAEACRATHGASDVLALLDARMDEVYWARYRWEDGWSMVQEPALARPETVPAAGEAYACGNGLKLIAAAMPEHPFTQRTDAAVMPHARWIAALAEAEFAAGRTVAARDAQPVYLRNKVAMTTAERMAKVTA